MKIIRNFTKRDKKVLCVYLLTIIIAYYIIHDKLLAGFISIIILLFIEQRYTLAKIIRLDEITKSNYPDVYIEIDKSDSLDKLYAIINEKGDSKIKITIHEKEKKYLFELKERRKFNYEMLKNLNKEQYIKKITV